MSIIIEILPLILLAFPGILLVSYSRHICPSLPRLVQINTIFLLSFGFNSWIFTLIRDLDALTRWSAMTYFIASWLLTSGIIVIMATRNKFLFTGKRIWQNHYGQYLLPLCMIGGFAVVSAYYAYFWPPTWWDALFYHLPIAKVSVDGSFRWYLNSKGSRFSWILASYPQSFEIMIALFFITGSSLYKLLPAFFGVSVLMTTYSLSKMLFKREGQALMALFLGIMSPALLLHSSQFYVDLPLTAFTAATITFIVLYMQSQHSKALYLASALAGFGTLIKLLGLHFTALMAILFGGSILLQQQVLESHERSAREGPFFQILVSAMLFFAIVSYWYIKRALFIEVPTYPAQPDVPLHWPEVFQALQVGIDSWLFGHDSRTGFPIPVLLGYSLALLQFLKSRQAYKLPFPIAWFVHSLVITWIVAVPLGIVLFVRRWEWFIWIGRYLLPVYPIMVVFAAHAWVEIIPSKKLTALVPRHSSRLSHLSIIGVGAAFVILVLIAGPTQLNRVAMRMNKYIPLYSTSKIVFNRVGDWNAPLRLPEQQKMREAYGNDLYELWNFVNRYVDEDDKILSEDTRCYYIEALCYDAAGLPHKASATQLRKWFVNRQIRLLIDSKSLHDFEVQNPNTYEFLRSAGRRVWENGSFVVYEILRNSDQLSARQ